MLNIERELVHTIYILLNQMNLTMKSKTLRTLFTMLALFSATAAMAHKYVNTPPEVSPMQMKPEMTEIWEPEVKVITPAKTLGSALQMPLFYLTVKNLDQWVSQKDASKLHLGKLLTKIIWKLFRVLSIQTKMAFGDCQLHLECARMLF
jgi:hypothetical protein